MIFFELGYLPTLKFNTSMTGDFTLYPLVTPEVPWEIWSTSLSPDQQIRIRNN